MKEHVINVAEYKYPEFTAEVIGEACDYLDKHIRYQMVSITKWTDRTENAREDCCKTYYFRVNETCWCIFDRIVKDEKWCKNIFTKYEKDSRFFVDDGRTFDSLYMSDEYER